jgi:hypothetical protein
MSADPPWQEAAAFIRYWRAATRRNFAFLKVL